jgi:steroid delta-isomerase-like uncharacterized protein
MHFTLTEYTVMKRFIIILPFVLCFITSCQDKAAKAELEHFKAQQGIEEQNIALIEKLFEEINNRNFMIYEELGDPQYGFYSPSINPDPVSREGLKEFADMILTAFPDASWDIKEIFAEGDRVIVWNVFSGTHEGEFQGIPGTGTKIQVSSILIFRIKDGKIVEEREEADMLGAMMQIGKI